MRWLIPVTLTCAFCGCGGGTRTVIERISSVPPRSAARRRNRLSRSSATAMTARSAFRRAPASACSTTEGSFRRLHRAAPSTALKRRPPASRHQWSANAGSGSQSAIQLLTPAQPPTPTSADHQESTSPSPREGLAIRSAKRAAGATLDRPMFRMRLLALLPFLARWVEVAPAACCGVCPTCIGSAVTSLMLPMVVKEKPETD